MSFSLKHIAHIILGFATCICLSCNSEHSKTHDENSESRVNELLDGAYSMLAQVTKQAYAETWTGASTNWLWGSVRGMEANLGTDSLMGAEILAIQTFSENSANTLLNDKWRMLYEGISRCNATVVKAGVVMEAGKISSEANDIIVKQARALRGYFHFEAWKMWNNIPYIDENTDPSSITNTADIRSNILRDLEAGTFLPDSMGSNARFNGTVCKVLLAKALMQMYHNYKDALILLLDVERLGRKPDGSEIGLANTFGEIFDMENLNSIESIYAVRFSASGASGNGAPGDMSNAGAEEKGMLQQYPGFLIPNQEFVNTFRTHQGLPYKNFEYNLHPVINDHGLPPSKPWSLSKSYQLNDIVSIADPNELTNRNRKVFKSLASNNTGNNPLYTPSKWKLAWQEDPDQLDPRIDWTIGRKGIPFWDWGTYSDTLWIGNQQFSASYGPKKQMLKKSHTQKFAEDGKPGHQRLSHGYHMIRYADVLLLIAECYIESAGTLSNLDAARFYINRVRHRAANPAGFVKDTVGNLILNAANYSVITYEEAFASVEDARYALNIERKLEFGLEGHRYFDLNRWGKTFQELNRIISYQKSIPSDRDIYSTIVLTPADTAYPVPQRQIDLSNGAIRPNIQP